jgi:hypothetical protein
MSAIGVVPALRGARVAFASCRMLPPLAAAASAGFGMDCVLAPE